MKIREHRGFLNDSMETITEIAPTKAALVTFLRNRMPHSDLPITEEAIRVEPYVWDERLGWDTHIVTLVGYGVLAFTDGPLENPNDGE